MPAQEYTDELVQSWDKKLTSGRGLGKSGFLVPVKKDTFGFWIFEKCTLTFAESAREFDFWILDF